MKQRLFEEFLLSARYVSGNVQVGLMLPKMGEFRKSPAMIWIRNATVGFAPVEPEA
jgi:hypothetical protein